MSRKLRYIPPGRSLVEVTCRTIQGRLLMRPSPLLNEIILGVLGRTQRLYPLDIVGYVFAMASIQSGAAIAKQLFPVVGTTGATALRLLFAGVLAWHQLQAARASHRSLPPFLPQPRTRSRAQAMHNLLLRIAT